MCGGSTSTQGSCRADREISATPARARPEYAWGC
jgi:hypothetical protein